MSKTYLSYIPHGINTKRFHPLPSDDEKMLETRGKLFGKDEVDFVVLYNSRNIRRKQTSDILLAFAEFMKLLPAEKQAKCRIVLHTQPVDDNGTDLVAVINDVVPQIKKNVVFSPHRADTDYLNHLYNIADVTINMSSNEGFGLGTCESMVAGTPIIVNVTGGLQDQCGFTDEEGNYLDPDTHFTYDWGSNHDGRYKTHGEWAFPIFPVSRSLQGSPLTPYIFDDRCDWMDAAKRLYELHNMTRDERKRRGLVGMEYAKNHGKFTAEHMAESFITHMNIAYDGWTPRKKFELVRA